MNTICTNILQSKKLIELGLDIKTADMHYMYRHWEIDEHTLGDQTDARTGCDPNWYNYHPGDNNKDFHYIPCWSLGALMDLMPKIKEYDNDGGCYPVLCKGWNNNLWHCVYRSSIHITKWHYNSLNAAFEMICWLLKNGYIKKGDSNE